MTANPPNTASTEDNILQLARSAGLRAFWHVVPRYTAGSPAMVPMGVAIRVAVQEFEARERQLTGVFGDTLKAEAEAGNLAGIAYARFDQPFKFAAELDALEARAALHRQRID